MPRNYNYIYKKLVENSTDIVGHIAYALYKEDKIKYIAKYKEEHQGQEPNEQDLEPFHNISCLDGSLERYRLMATTVLQSFLNYSLEESTKEIEDQCVNSHKQMLKEVVDPLKPISKFRQFWSGVLQSIVGAFIFALILAAIGFITFFKTNDINISFTSNENSKSIEKIVSQDSVNTNAQQMLDRNIAIQ